MKRRSIVMAPLLIAASLSCDSTNPAGSQATKVGAPRPGVSGVTLPPDDQIVAGQTLYVPLYGHVYTADNAEPLNLAATLYVRNTDRKHPVIVTQVQFVDSGGKAVRNFLQNPLSIGPLATMDFFLKESDVTGGGSPSFIVDRVALEPVSEPIVESVMIGTVGTQGISFTCTGTMIATRKP